MEWICVWRARSRSTVGRHDVEQSGKKLSSLPLVKRRLTIGSGQTIQGSGNLGIGQTTFTNNGTIIANQSTALVLQPGGGTADFINSAGGILRADGGTLQLSGSSGGVFTNNGTIEALNGSLVQLINNASLVGGTLATTGSAIHSLGAGLTNVTNNGDFVLDNGTTTTLVNTFTNNGTFTFGNAGNGVDLRLAGPVTINGSGSMTLNNQGNNRLFANNSGDRLTIGANQTIQGSGNLGIGQTTFTNNGTIIANQSTALIIQPGGGSADFTNNGTLRANNAILQLTGGTFNSSGTIAAINGGTLRFNATVNSSGTVNVGSAALTATGNYTQTAGNFLLAGGSVQSTNALNFQGGLIDAWGSINAAIMNNATLRPALGGSGLNVTGNISLLSSSQLTFQLSGLTQGTQYGFLNVNGMVGLGGNLAVALLGSFEPSNSDVFTVLSSTAALTGAFANVASGDGLLVSDSSGVFTVTYSGSDVVLSNFMPVVSADGLNFAGKNSAAGNGGNAGALRLTASSVTFGSGTGQIHAANFSGGNAVPNSSFLGGDGGNFALTATKGNITIGTDIEASSGFSGRDVIAGKGGSVSLNANSGVVTISDRVQVSHDDASRRSASGGTIALKSGMTSGVAINVTNSGQLLSLLDAAAPGPGGKIVIQATAAKTGVFCLMTSARRNCPFTSIVTSLSPIPRADWPSNVEARNR